jgi:8-oxo-dGTP pyrophosphatase MutT (NUDIX family)
MYNIYFDNKVITIIKNLSTISIEPNDLVFENPNDEQIFEVGKFIKNNIEFDKIYLTSNQPQEIFKTLSIDFKIIEAAGGVVLNNKNEVLFIYRLKKWDLPKGKIEIGENPETAAIREVEEETGISDLNIVQKLDDTYHIYEHKGKFVLKKTYWFEMKTKFEGKLIPQIEEDIIKAEWLDKNQIIKALENSYKSILQMPYWDTQNF